MSDATDTMILKQLMEIENRLGSIDTKLEAGAALHKEMKEQMDMVDRRTDICETKTIKIEEILVPDDGKPLVKRVEVLETFHGKIGAIVVAATAVVTGAAYLIYAGIGMFHDEIKNFIKGFWR